MNKSFKEALLVPKSLSDSNHSTQRRDEDNLTRADTSTARESYIKTRPGLESRGNSFNDEDIRGEEEFLLAGNPLDPPPSDKDPLAPPAVDGDEVDHSWRRADAIATIRPVPVLFSDKFRWTLRGRESHAVA